jgi:hypothetical protein
MAKSLKFPTEFSETLHINGSDANTKSQPEVEAEGQKRRLLRETFFLTL